MGASQSKQQRENEQVFYNSVPIQVGRRPTSHVRAHATNEHTPTHTTQVSSELATQLSDTSLSPEVSPARHALLDQAVRAKLGAEAARLRGRDHDGGEEGKGGVDIVQREIEAALERENLDRERGMVGHAEADAGADADADGAHGDVKNSTVLLGDLEEVRQKVDRYRARARLTEHPEVQNAREAIASCYRYVLHPLMSLGARVSTYPNLLLFPTRANPTTTLNCWSQVTAFRTAVAKLEQVAPFSLIRHIVANH